MLFSPNDSVLQSSTASLQIYIVLLNSSKMNCAGSPSGNR